MAEASAPLISVIIPARNAASTIGECLRSVTAQRFDQSYEILVVDNGSTDRTGEVARVARALVVEETRPGASAARNAGVKAARGEWIAFTDADCVADPDWLAAHWREAAGGSGVAYGGALLPYSVATAGERWQAERRVLDPAKFMLEPEHGLPPFFVTANAFIPRAAIVAVGGFDESIAYSEDADLCWRLQWNGVELAFNPAAKVAHRHRGELRDVFWQNAHYAEALAHLLAKHKARLGRRALIDPAPYGWAAKMLLKAPVSWMMERDPYLRLRPTYDLAGACGMIAGRWRGAVKHGVMAF